MGGGADGKSLEAHGLVILANTVGNYRDLVLDKNQLPSCLLTTHVYCGMHVLAFIYENIHTQTQKEKQRSERKR